MSLENGGRLLLGAAAGRPTTFWTLTSMLQRLAGGAALRFAAVARLGAVVLAVAGGGCEGEGALSPSVKEDGGASEVDTGSWQGAVAGLPVEHAPPPNVGVTYRAHVRGNGWMSWVYDGVQAGTTGQNRRMEAVEIRLTNPPASPTMQICYSAHVRGSGWLGEVCNGATGGTTGQNRQMEAVKIRLVNAPAGCSVTYTTHVGGQGWQGWVSNNAVSGTTGQNRQIEAIKVQLSGTCTAPCNPDVLEPNDSSLSATFVNPGTTTGLTACLSDRWDWYEVDAVQGERVKFLVDYAEAEGDIDLYALDHLRPSDVNTLNVVALTSDVRGTTGTNQAVVEFAAALPGTYWVGLYLKSDLGLNTQGGVPYSFSYSRGCGRDALETNDSPAAAVQFQLRDNLMVCTSDRWDWYRYEPGESGNVTITAFHDYSDADIDVYVYGSVVDAQAQANSIAYDFDTVDNAVVTFDVVSDEAYWIGVNMFSDRGGELRDGGLYRLELQNNMFFAGGWGPVP